ncbi:MAG: dTMP kinase [Rhodobacter sp.]|jgi:dTMP kinase|nr:dTMP kinase [Rhodobacter sp.]
MFITICGIDGSGKTTLGQLLADELGRLPGSDGKALKAIYTKIVTAESPFVRFFKQLIDTDPHFGGASQNYVFAFERVRTAEEVLQPILDKHDITVVDRFVYCDMAFSAARGDDGRMHRIVLNHVPTPDLCFITDVPVEVAMARIVARDEAPWPHQENEHLLRKARQTYLALAEEFGFSVIDTSRGVQASLDDMLRVVRSKLGVAAARPPAVTGAA